MATLELTRNEIKENFGKSRKTARIELDARGIPYRLTKDGWPAVAREVYLKYMAGNTVRFKRQPRVRSLHAKA